MVADTSDGVWTEALTDNYLKLRLAGRHEPNRWIHAHVDAAEGGQLLGILETHLDRQDAMLCDHG
jgi:hypothetical protein